MINVLNNLDAEVIINILDIPLIKEILLIEIKLIKYHSFKTIVSFLIKSEKKTNTKEDIGYQF